jgi:predicted regulator of Ras-like GTPase activity (Roadblock/LC7/MglB family)
MRRFLTIGAAALAALAILSATPLGVEAQQAIRNVVVDEDSLLVTETSRAADGIENIGDNLSVDCAKGNAITECPEGPAGVGYAKDFDGSAFPDAVTEGQAQYRAVSMSGVNYAMLVSEDGSLQYGTTTTPLVVDLGVNNDVAAVPTAATSGGCTPGSSISAGAVLETEIKATAGQLYQLVVTNLDATPVFARLYNDTAANTDENDTPVQRFVVPTQGNGNGAGFVLPINIGQVYSTAITLRVTTGGADTNTGALSATEVFVSYCYK